MVRWHLLHDLPDSQVVHSDLMAARKGDALSHDGSGTRKERLCPKSRRQWNTQGSVVTMEVSILPSKPGPSAGSVGGTCEGKIRQRSLLPLFQHIRTPRVVEHAHPLLPCPSSSASLLLLLLSPPCPPTSVLSSSSPLSCCSALAGRVVKHAHRPGPRRSSGRGSGGCRWRHRANAPPWPRGPQGQGSVFVGAPTEWRWRVVGTHRPVVSAEGGRAARRPYVPRNSKSGHQLIQNT